MLLRPCGTMSGLLSCLSAFSAYISEMHPLFFYAFLPSYLTPFMLDFYLSILFTHLPRAFILAPAEALEAMTIQRSTTCESLFLVAFDFEECFFLFFLILLTPIIKKAQIPINLWNLSLGGFKSLNGFWCQVRLALPFRIPYPESLNFSIMRELCGPSLLLFSN